MRLLRLVSPCRRHGGGGALFRACPGGAGAKPPKKGRRRSTRTASAVRTSSGVDGAADLGEPFRDGLFGARVRKSQVAGRAERCPRHRGYVGDVEKPKSDVLVAFQLLV